MKKILLLVTLLAATLASCDRDGTHIVVPANPERPQDGAVIVSFGTDGLSSDTKFGDTHLYGFNASQKMVFHKYYPTQQALAADLLTVENGAYTFVAVVNAGPDADSNAGTDAVPPSSHRLLPQLLSYFKQFSARYPDMLTGMTAAGVTAGEVSRIEIPLSTRAEGIVLTTIGLDITLPDAEFADYQNARVRATLPHNLRGVAEFYRKGTTELLLHTSQILVPAATEGHYTLQADMPDGDYDVLLWVDYTESGSTEDLWYDTRSLLATRILSTDMVYPAGSDTREVFYGTAFLSVTSGLTASGNAASLPTLSLPIATVRPQAKYVLIADDIARYHELQEANPDKYVPLDELSVTVVYEGYLPDGFNVSAGKPNSSQMGYSYTAPLPAVGDADTEVSAGTDYVLVNGSESVVTVTVLVTDRDGRTVSRVQGIEIHYKRNMLTTVRGDFLTAGVVNPGLNIDTDWEGIFNVEF